MAAMYWSHPPIRGTREEFDRWCAEMEARHYSVWLIAQKLGVSENKVLRAIERVKCGRYDG